MLNSCEFRNKVVYLYYKIRDSNNQKKIKDMTLKEKVTATYFVQETIGGWKQNYTFRGTLKECREYLDEWCHNGSFSVVPEWGYEVDYL